MQIDNTFNSRRFANLFILDFQVYNKRSLIAFSSAIIGMSILTYVLTYMNGVIYVDNSSIQLDMSWITAITSLLCLILTAQSHKLYFKPNIASSQIMLPATKLEKFLQKLLQTLVVNPLILFTVIFLSYIVMAHILGVNFSEDLWNTTSISTHLNKIMFYCFMHSIYFFGSIIFRRKVFNKITLALILLMALISSTIAENMKNIIEFITGQDFYSYTDINDFIKIIPQWISFLKTITIVSLTILFWWLSWIKFKKLQITK